MSRKIEKIVAVFGLICCIASLSECREDMSLNNGINNKVLDEKLSLIRSIKKDIENQYYLINTIAENLISESDIPDFYREVLKNKAKLDSLVPKESSSEIDLNENFNERQNFMKRFDWFKRNMYTSRYSKIPVIRTG
ncbi:hypothetical protein BpHYR1_032290 [Brachionus plicatilis]|uniref:Uncharacterized protein n=1 Tax=Brachionus plicatilis TaxID=10195 RepID=A0A3M7Q540_BRAPC|nr:hypothetical protein BpHYR1_032290 [Brachionus plicatilis]